MIAKTSASAYFPISGSVLLKITVIYEHLHCIYLPERWFYRARVASFLKSCLDGWREGKGVVIDHWPLSTWADRPSHLLFRRSERRDSTGSYENQVMPPLFFVYSPISISVLSHSRSIFLHFLFEVPFSCYLLGNSVDSVKSCLDKRKCVQEREREEREGECSPNCRLFVSQHSLRSLLCYCLYFLPPFYSYILQYV